MTTEQESIGRIEVAPEVILTIVRQEVLGINGVWDVAPVPSEVSHLFRRSPRQEGVVLDFAVNLHEASRAIQVAVIEAIDKMVGVPVAAVNVHVEDVVYQQGQTA